MDSGAWRNFAPWFLTITSTVVMVGLGYFLVSNIEWYKDTAFNTENSLFCLDSQKNILERFHLHSSLIKRSVSMFAGVGVLLIGLGVSFYTIDRMTHTKISTGGLAFQLATASPGIVALFIGAVLIITTLTSKDTFQHNINPNGSTSTSIQHKDPLPKNPP